MKSVKKIICLGLCMLFFIIQANELCAQDTSVSNIWLNGGIGFSSIGSLAGNASLNLQFGHALVTLRTAGYLEETGIFSGGDEYSDLAILFGYNSINPNSSLSISVGVAKVSGSRFSGRAGLFRGGKRNAIKPTIGVVIGSQLMMKISSAFGIGVNPYINFNQEQSLLSLTFCLNFGKLN